MNHYVRIRGPRGDLLREAGPMPVIPTPGTEIRHAGVVITVFDAPPLSAREAVDGEMQTVHELIGVARPEIVPFPKPKKR